MSKASEIRSRAREIQSRLRERLTRLASAGDDAFDRRVQAVESSLVEYDELLDRDDGRILPWSPDARDRIARCRMELKHLQFGGTLRRDAIGLIRLVLPRFEEAEEGPVEAEEGPVEADEGPGEGDSEGTGKGTAS
jgi:hypothetical protein